MAHPRTRVNRLVRESIKVLRKEGIGLGGLYRVEVKDEIPSSRYVVTIIISSLVVGRKYNLGYNKWVNEANLYTKGLSSKFSSDLPKR